MADPVIVLTPDQLRELVRDAVREALEDRQRDEDALLDEEAAAELLACKPSHLRDLRRRHGLPHVKLGPRLVRYRRAELLEWAEETGRR